MKALQDAYKRAVAAEKKGEPITVNDAWIICLGEVMKSLEDKK